MENLFAYSFVKDPPEVKLASDPNIDEGTALKLATHENREVRKSLSRNQSISERVIDLLLQYPNDSFGTKESLLVNSKISDKQIVELIFHSPLYSYLKIDSIPDESDGIDEILKQIIKAELNSHFIATLLCNPRVTAPVVNDILKFREIQMIPNSSLCNALERKDVSASVLDGYSDSNVGIIRNIVAIHKNTSPETLTAMFLQKRDPATVANVSKNLNTPLELTASFHSLHLASYDNDMLGKLNMLANRQLDIYCSGKSGWDDLPLSWKLNFLAKVNEK